MHKGSVVARHVHAIATRYGKDEAVRRLHKLAMLAQGQTRSELLTEARNLQTQA